MLDLLTTVWFHRICYPGPLHDCEVIFGQQLSTSDGTFVPSRTIGLTPKMMPDLCAESIVGEIKHVYSLGIVSQKWIEVKSGLSRDYGALDILGNSPPCVTP